MNYPFLKKESEKKYFWGNFEKKYFRKKSQSNSSLFSTVFAFQLSLSFVYCLVQHNIVFEPCVVYRLDPIESHARR